MQQFVTRSVNARSLREIHSANDNTGTKGGKVRKRFHTSAQLFVLLVRLSRNRSFQSWSCRRTEFDRAPSRGNRSFFPCLPRAHFHTRLLLPSGDTALVYVLVPRSMELLLAPVPSTAVSR